MIVKINRGQPNERVIGELYPAEKIFLKRIRSSKHVFQKLDAIGIDAEYFDQVLLPEKYFIEVQDLDTGITYGIDAEVMKKIGQYFHFKNAEDHRAQLFLPRSQWLTA